MADITKISSYIDSAVDSRLTNSSQNDIAETSSIFFNNNDEILTSNINSTTDNEIELLVSTLEARNQTNADYVEKVFSKIKNISDDESLQEFINASDEQLATSNKSSISGTLDAIKGSLSSTLGSLKELIVAFAGSEIGEVITRGISAGISALTTDYQDGVSETEYGQAMQGSWVGKGEQSFLDSFVKQDASMRKVRIMASTPMDRGSDKRSALFGSLMMGCPYTYGGFSDPRNRQFINTFVKDGRFVSFTPGFPQYNGGYYMQGTNNILNQTPTGSQMLDYLLKNGLDSSFKEKDKRFYTFATDYETYYSYLEAMLNPIWLKLGLGTVDNKTFDIFSFFDIKKPSKSGSGDIDTAGANKLKNQYRSSLGFFLNGPAGVSESTSSDLTSYGSETSNYINDQSEAYQRINYFTGMGTGNTLNRIAKMGAAGVQLIKNTKGVFSDISQNARSGASQGASIGRTLGRALGNSGAAIGALAGWGVGLAAGAALDILSATGERDLSSIVQSFTVTNGLKTVHPELWGDSNYSRGINLNFEFVSPYGDPMSIFKFVYVPFCALLCMSLPRAAADNGYVSPMFIRCDIPGLVTSDLAVISDCTWVKGGQGNIWSKDNLPRAMSVSITVSDLYPFLAMSKRMSALSANPSYAVFLDNMAGLCSVYDTANSDDPLNTYWHRLINRVNGVTENTGLWNKFNPTTQKAYNSVNQTSRQSVSARSSGVNYSTISWMDKI